MYRVLTWRGFRDELGFYHLLPLLLSRSNRIGSSWGQEEESGASDAPAEIQVDASQLPLLERADGEKVFRFYWLDAFEDPYNQPGKIIFTRDEIKI